MYFVYECQSYTNISLLYFLLNNHIDDGVPKRTCVNIIGKIVIEIIISVLVSQYFGNSISYFRIFAIAISFIEIVSSTDISYF